MKRRNSITSIATTTASNGTASSQTAPHRKNAAQRNRSDSPYQGRTAQKDNHPVGSYAGEDERRKAHEHDGPVLKRVERDFADHRDSEVNRRGRGRTAAGALPRSRLLPGAEAIDHRDPPVLFVPIDTCRRSYWPGPTSTNR